MNEGEDLAARYVILRQQEAEIEAQIDILLKKSFRVSAKADFMRGLFRDKTGNWLDKEGNIIILNPGVHFKP